MIDSATLATLKNSREKLIALYLATALDIKPPPICKMEATMSNEIGCPAFFNPSHKTETSSCFTFPKAILQDPLSKCPVCPTHTIHKPIGQFFYRSGIFVRGQATVVSWLY